MENYINKIIQGDCLEVMKTMAEKSVDMVLTSPPYDNLRTYKGYTFNFEGIAKELYRVLKDGGVCVWIVGDATIKGSETGTSFKQALYFKEIGFNLHDTMIWRKTNAMPQVCKTRYTQAFEYMFIFSKGKPKTFNMLEVPTKFGGKIIKNHTSNPESIMRKKDKIVLPTKYTKIDQNVWNFNNFGTNYGHPAIFPEKLAEDHILSWSNEGDIILDPMAGSGTTLKMAKKNNRNYIGIEIAPEYIEIINKRLSQDSLWK